MNIFQAIILGIVEGITEFLPISSTGHLILADKLLRVEQNEFLKTFEIAIQLGAILAVIFLYRKMLLKSKIIWQKILIAFLPTAILGFIFYKLIKQYLLSNESLVVWSLLVGGLFLIIFEFFHKENLTESNIESISNKHSFFIGLAQSVSMIPGVSRAAATILGGLALNIPRKTIVEFSFLLAIPTMAAATGLDLVNSYQSFSSSNLMVLLVGFIVSFLVAIIAIKFLLQFIQNHSFAAFGWYRVVVALVFWWFLL